MPPLRVKMKAEKEDNLTKKNYLYLTAAVLLTLSLPLGLTGEAASAADAPHVIKTPDSKYLEKIEIYYQDKKPWFPEASAKRGKDGALTIHLGLGEPIAYRFVPHPKSGGKAKFRIEQQYETSLSLMREGPHLDLSNWKHHVSSWDTLEETETNTFLSKEVSSSELPDVSNAEIVSGVKAELAKWSAQGYSLGGDWAELAKKCKSPKDDPCGVSISQVRLKISVKDGNDWKAIQIIKLIVPMGC